MGEKTVKNTSTWRLNNSYYITKRPLKKSKETKMQKQMAMKAQLPKTYGMQQKQS